MNFAFFVVGRVYVIGGAYFFGFLNFVCSFYSVEDDVISDIV